MPDVHKYIGLGIVLAFMALWVWGLVLWIRKRHEAGRGFWGLLAAVQVVLGIQVVVGLILLAAHGIHSRPILHYLYGVFAVALLVIAHVVARSLERDQWVAFAWASFFCFGLTLRALQTGCGGVAFDAIKHCLSS